MRDRVNRPLRTTALRVATCLLLAGGVVSCAKNGDAGSSASGPAATDKAATQKSAGKASEKMGEHWVQNTRLRDLMKTISQETQTKWPNGLPQDPEDPVSKDPDAPFKQAAALADGLAAAAVRIPASVADVQMAEADRRAFEAEAATLRDQAYQLRQHATGKKVEQMQQSLNAISATCIACHSRFRDFAGQLDVQRVTADDHARYQALAALGAGPGGLSH